MKENNKADECRRRLLDYMKKYLNKEISAYEFYGLSESFFTEYGEDLAEKYKEFENIYMENVPDICLFYLDESKDEKLFYKNIKEVYDKLKDLYL